MCDSEWGLTTESGWVCVALEAVDLEFYVWSEPLLCLEQFTGWRQMVFVKEKRKKEKVVVLEEHTTSGSQEHQFKFLQTMKSPTSSNLSDHLLTSSWQQPQRSKGASKTLDDQHI